MNARHVKPVLLISCVSFLFCAVVLGQYAIESHTIDCGGGTSIGGGFEINGTIGQPDASSPASPLTGGGYALQSGFWALPSGCTCPGDLDGNAQVNGGDIQLFVDCLLHGGDCTCADLDGTGGVSSADVGFFVSLLVSGAGCP